ncbi:Glycosyl transferase, group 1 [Lactobacillus helveticus H10]|nr:Glycosyl transferase, group 1 [Lactobacillus helveticus H10]
MKKGTVEPNIFRFSSIPFVSFTDRRIAFRGLFEATKVAKEVNLDIVHTQTEFALGTIGKYVAHQLDIPAIHTYHTMYEDYLHYILNGHLLRPYHVKQFVKSYLKNMDGCIAPSGRVEELLRRYGVQIPIRVIPTGVDIQSMNRDADRDVRKDLGIDKDAPVILTLSRIAAEKKINHILNVLPAIIDEIPNVKFVIAGDGPDVKVLQEQVERLTLEDYVIFAGNVDHGDVGNYYRMADIFVSASDTETQGLTYVEALAVGTPCVVYNTDYTENIFDKDIFGRRFNTQQEMQEEIISLLKQKRSKIPQELLQNKLQSISSDQFATNVHDFYQYVIDHYRPKHEED